MSPIVLAIAGLDALGPDGVGLLTVLGSHEGEGWLLQTNTA